MNKLHFISTVCLLLPYFIILTIFLRRNQHYIWTLYNTVKQHYICTLHAFTIVCTIVKAFKATTSKSTKSQGPLTLSVTCNFAHSRVRQQLPPIDVQHTTVTYLQDWTLDVKAENLSFSEYQLILHTNWKLWCNCNLPERWRNLRSISLTFCSWVHGLTLHGFN